MYGDIIDEVQELRRINKELLEALEALVSRLGSTEGHVVWPCNCTASMCPANMARAAIEKASGTPTA